MTLTIETSNIQEVEQLLHFLNTMNLKKINIKPQSPQPIVTAGDATIDPTSLFGIWQTEPKTLESIRSTAWQRNQ